LIDPRARSFCRVSGEKKAGKREWNTPTKSKPCAALKLPVKRSRCGNTSQLKSFWANVSGNTASLLAASFFFVLSCFSFFFFLFLFLLLTCRCSRLDPNMTEAKKLLVAVQKLQSHASKPAPASSSGNSNNNNATKSSSSSSNARDTGNRDEAAWVKKIMAGRSYYDILGVQRTCSSSELKKAYRKTSLKVHPDKNSAKGSVEAFQKVTDAYDVLSDERKKEIYDQVGHERFTDQVRAGGADSAAHAAGGFHGFQGGQMNAEDLFNMFFAQQNGGGAGFSFGNGARFRMHRAQQQQQRGARPRRTAREEAEYRAQQQRFQWFSGVPILLMMIVLWLGGALLSGSPAFSLHRSSSYPVRRFTFATKDKLEYFVGRDFGRQYPSKDDVFRIEREVWAEWMKVLEQNCGYERRERNSKLYWTFGEKRRQLESVPLPHCVKYQQVRNDRPVKAQ
jgi:hypothetical protein